MLAASSWAGRRVLVTGNTGFKGGWLSSLLLGLGCEVEGFALPPDTNPSFFEQTGLGERMSTVFGDVRDLDTLYATVRRIRPEVIFHLAAQPLVLRSYEDPIGTFSTNVLGTANLLESTRSVDSVRAVVVVTSDKCYENTGKREGYSEGDALGGSDPYSASKGCAELVCASYRRSFFNQRGVGLATARAGNVMGGGDYSKDRLIPDAIRSLNPGLPIPLRNPLSVRPWQHVLEPLHGYLLLAEQLLAQPRDWSESWNFGPSPDNWVSVSELAALVVRSWGSGSCQSAEQESAPHEATHLTLDSAKARSRLGWNPNLSLLQNVELTVEWYRTAVTGTKSQMAALTDAQIIRYQAAPLAPAAQ